ncbi:diacylglycerol/lipid kinase family protein [Marinoscillum furvescens]|uniref:YegS/Rv2252/BmrU family lipid kinase n=1 Tax=Marinoscillum furvescens DSM 4134 TaxID=1122208 RepID=A0A3D9L3I4_MARFU|nr:diacylglycerol kinase family protein [Marinoscillum furvescens]RED97530.1 YegS/Rv2252/BmrU family lipid kinase [Marinoscillum furvescens DSM 4134]
MKKLLFVINPVSGGTDKSELIEKIKAYCRNYEVSAEWLHTTGENDPERLQDAIAQHQPDQIALAGGDGTLHELTPVLIQHKTTIGIIPSGSANGLARELGITMQNALETIFEASDTIHLDVVHINSQEPMIHMADLGLNANLVRRYEQESRRGFLGYAISAMKELPSLDDPVDVEITAHGQSYKFNTNFVGIANARMYGTGYNLNPNGKLDDGRFELCILKELSPRLLTDRLFFDEENHESELFEYLSVSEASIHCSRAMPLQSDGEYLGEFGSVTLTLAQNHLRILTPKRPH